MRAALSRVMLACAVSPRIVLSCIVLSCIVLACIDLACIVLACVVLACIVLACAVSACAVAEWDLNDASCTGAPAALCSTQPGPFALSHDVSDASGDG